MATEQLKCEFGKGHKWTRERTRGRKPRFCTKHKPSTEDSATGRVPIMKSFTSVGAIVAPGTVKLHCEIGDHYWQRVSQRGRKPSNCPEHAIVKPVSVPTTRTKPTRAASTKDNDGLATVLNIDDYKEQRELLEANRKAREAKAKLRIDNLEMMLRSRGMHLSQQPGWQPPVDPSIEAALADKPKARKGRRKMSA